MAQNEYQKHSVKDETHILSEQIQRSGGFIVGFKEGFNKDMELNSEKSLEYSLNLTAKLKADIARVKIESCYYPEYLNKAIYAEAHCHPHVSGLPFVYNVHSKKYVSTERTYLKEEFLELKEKYQWISGSEFELCLFDSNPNFDDYWLSFYKD